MIIKSNSVPNFLFEKSQPKIQTRKRFSFNNLKKVSNANANANANNNDNNDNNDNIIISSNKKSVIRKVYDSLFNT